MDMLGKTAIVLSAIGAINWGLLSFFNYNLASLLTGYEKWIYGIIAAAGLYALYLVFMAKK